MDLRQRASDKLDGSEKDQLEGRAIKGTVEFFQSFAQGLPWIVLGLFAVYFFGPPHILMNLGPLKLEGTNIGLYGSGFVVIISVGYIEYKNLHCSYPGIHE